jgi:centromeric protein E
VLAYGQTSTGKTFSMTGTPSSPGIIPLAIHQCFQCLEKNREYLIRVSYLEVYKEQIRDLLADGASQIRLFDHREQGLIIKGLREEVVTCPKQIFEILAQGEKRRKIGATNMNQHSSRSHVMVRMWIESRAIGTSGSNNNGSGGKRHSTTSMASNSKGGTPVRVSSLSLVDLAGSESVKLHGSDEARRQEGHYINKSLMALGQVVYALSEQGKQKDNRINSAPQHIPYRDSKLTRLLQPSLSGNAQMVLICCISPLATHVEESHNTFKFAARAKKVPQKATIQESMDEKTLLQTYREEIEALKQQLREAKKQQEALLAKQQEKQQQPQQELPVAVEPVEDEMDDEVEELQLAIRNMEHLILKSKAGTSPGGISRSFSEDELMDSSEEEDDDDDEAALLALMTETQKSSGVTRLPGQGALPSPARTPPGLGAEDTSSDMYAELHRIQGLLGSVLKKRSRGQKAPSNPNGIATPNPKNLAEVNKLRAQLEEQEVKSSLRQADAAFLTKQLEEKDGLLAEVAKILDQVEQRQIELEAENADLKKQILALKQGTKYSPINRLRNGMIDL